MLELTVPEILKEIVGDRTPRQNLHFRYIPLQVIARAKKHLEKTKDSVETAKYILYSFYVYRETVNRDMFAPHYPYFGAYQWPSPVGFSWGNINAVCAIGESVYGDIPRKEKGIIIQTQENGKIIETSLNPETGTSETKIRDLINGKDNLREVLKYKVDTSKTEAIMSNVWQNESLEKYVCPLYNFVFNCLEGRTKKEKALEILRNFLSNSKRMNII